MGKDIGAIPVLKKIVASGHRLILYTMRSGDTLEAAVKWFERNGIPLFGVNANPTQRSWTRSPKVYAHIYIDDAALGCPVKYAPESERVFVDWQRVDFLLEQGGLFSGLSGRPE